VIIDCPACDLRHVILDRANGTVVRCECTHQFRLPANLHQDPSTKCSNCGANPPAGARHCAFCDAHLATLRCGRCMAQSVEGDRHCRACGHLHGADLPRPVARPDHVLSCPRCDNTLRLTTAGNTTIDDCEHCGGVWLDLDVFEQTLTREEDKKALLSAVATMRPLQLTHTEARPESSERFYVPCPHCSVIMDRRQFARISGVVVDLCKRHGIWLDHDELPQIIRFVSQGGLQAARKFQLERQVDDLLRRRSNAAGTTSGRPAYPTPSTISGASLFDVVAGLLSALMR